MKIRLPYGSHSSLKLETAEDAEVYMLRSGRRSVPVAEFARMVACRLENPLGYPPLGACLMQGDRVAIPLAPDVPEGERVVAGIFEYLLSGESLPAAVTVLRSPDETVRVSDEAFKNRVLALLPEGLLESASETQFTVLTHTPGVKESHALLGASVADESLVVSRELFDADFILPVGVFMPPKTPGYDAIHSGLYPLFSDENTRNRFVGKLPEQTPQEKRFQKTQSAELSPAQRRAAEKLARREESRDATRQLGVTLAVMVLPNIPRAVAEGMTRVADVMVGAYETLTACGAARYRRMWRLEGWPRARTVVASITGGPDQQTWENVSRALENAARFVDEDADGTIFLATEITAPPGPAMETYRRVQDAWMSLQIIRAEPDFPDADAARRMIPLLERFRVYFISPLEEDLLHELNISCLERLSDLRRLVANSETCVFLPDAHRVEG